MSNETPHRDEPSRDPEFGRDEIIQPTDGTQGRTAPDESADDAMFRAEANDEARALSLEEEQSRLDRSAQAPTEDDALRAAAEHDSRLVEAERMAAHDEAEREAGFRTAMDRDDDHEADQATYGATPVSTDSGSGRDEVHDAHEFHANDSRPDADRAEAYRDAEADGRDDSTRDEPTPLIEPEPSSGRAFAAAPPPPPAPPAPPAPAAAGVTEDRDWDAGTPASVQASSETVAPAEPAPAEPAVASAPSDAPTTAYPGSGATAIDADVPTTAYPAAPSEPAQPQVIYVTQPNPPRDRGNRGIGALLAIVAAIVFALLYAGAAVLLITIANEGTLAIDSGTSFFLNAAFWVPVAVFAIAYVLLALLVNRAGWWAHALGGLVVALLTYGSFVAVAIWSGGGTTEDLGRLDIWFHPLAIAAFVLAREVPIWFGAAIGARGRRVRTRNIEAREQYEREQAAARAEANYGYR